MSDELPRLTARQAAVVGAFTGILAGPFSDLHEYVEQILGRPVMTGEMASDSVAEAIREASRADFGAIVHER